MPCEFLAWHPFFIDYLRKSIKDNTALESIISNVRPTISNSKTTCFTFKGSISITRKPYLQDSKTSCFTSLIDVCFTRYPRFLGVFDLNTRSTLPASNRQRSASS